MTAPRIGRPPLDNPRTHVFQFRLTADEWRALEDAAREVGQPTRVYARDAALREARRDTGH